MVADANPPFATALTVSEGTGKYTIRNSGGTSAAAPLWAGLIALADQYAGRHLGFVNPAHRPWRGSLGAQSRPGLQLRSRIS